MLYMSMFWNHPLTCSDVGQLLSVYSPDMPKRLPVKDIVSGLFRSVGRAVLSWLHYTLVAIAWLGVVPLTACEYHPYRVNIF